MGKLNAIYHRNIWNTLYFKDILIVRMQYVHEQTREKIKIFILNERKRKINSIKV